MSGPKEAVQGGIGSFPVSPPLLLFFWRNLWFQLWAPWFLLDTHSLNSLRDLTRNKQMIPDLLLRAAVPSFQQGPEHL